MEKSELETTNKLLKIILGLLLRRDEQNTISLRQQIEILDNHGLKPAEIADILGRTNNYVRVELAKIRKGRKKGK